MTSHAAGAAHNVAAAEFTQIDVAAIGANVTLTLGGAFVGQVAGAIVTTSNGANTVTFAGLPLPLGGLKYVGESAIFTWDGAAWVLVDVNYDYASRKSGTDWTVADAAARLALTVTAADVGKTALQTDLARIFVLKDDSPMVWGEAEADDVPGWREYWGTSATPQFLGFSTTLGGGTLASATPANTNAGTRLMRTNLATAAAINQALQLRATTPFPAGGGIRLMFEFSLVGIASNQRWGVGIGLATAALTAAGAMTANVDCFFVGRDAGEANVGLYHNDGAGAATRVDLGASFPGATADTRYMAEFYTRDGSSWTVNLLNVGTRAEVSASVAAEIPTVASNYSWQIFGNTNSDATALNAGIGEIKMAPIYR